MSPPQKKKNKDKKQSVILHPYLPITATYQQRPLSSVPKVAVMERLDCNLKNPKQ